jgi:hypothetical protein
MLFNDVVQDLLQLNQATKKLDSTADLKQKAMKCAVFERVFRGERL